jgi:hypothetical protein
LAGETTVGSIQGFLRLDADQFHREIERAIAETDVLDGKRVDVKVRTNTSEVDRATSSVGRLSGGLDGVAASSRRLEDASARVGVAESRLSELRVSGKAKASQLLAAESALTKARRAEQDVIFASYDANVKAAHAQDDVGRSARGAERDVRKLGKSFGDMGGGGIMSPQVIVGGIAAAMALLGPVTGAATAAMGGFVGVAGTGVLAFRGFQQEVQKGTALGQYLQGSLEGIKTEFDSLGTTAASAMQGDVLSGLSEIRRFLPTINPEVEALAGHLGRAFHTSAKGVVSGLQNMMPLLEDGGRYAEMLANKFAEFAASQEFRNFVAYARRELPNVGEALLSLANGIKDVGVALAPVGDDLIELISVSGKAASAIAPVVSLLSGALKQQTGGGGEWAAAKGLKSVEDAAVPATAAVDEHTSHLLTLQTVQSATATVLGTTDTALRNAEQAHKQTTAAAAAATLQMQVEGDAAGLLQQQLDKLNGKAINAEVAQNAFDSALANSNKHIAANGKTIDRATTSLQGNSAAAVANRGELIRQVQAAEGVATAMRDNGASTDETRAKMVTMRDEIIANAKEHGLNAAAVQKFIDKIYHIPKKVAPTKLEVETKAALTGIAAFQKAIDSLHGKTVTANVRYAYTGKLPNGGRSTQGGSTFGEADGGVVHYYAGGGFENHAAQIAPAGAMRLWAEPETGGEAYIPLAPSKRARSKAIWEETGRMLGMGGDGGGLSQFDIDRLAAAFARVQVQSVVSAGSFDRVMGGQIR